MNIIKIAADEFGVDVEDIMSRNREVQIVQARQVVMYLLWINNDFTLKKIGQMVGGRCPANVSYGCQKIAKAIFNDTEFKDKVLEIVSYETR